ncbi:hypothetical protein IGX34_15460 [Dyella sp. 7MK23]|uniref:Uncharacterized protein n=1 Tax=Dyella acidiphila TaxID=2775866 RepID=A0ABR9GCL5_9GAMM|nr:hypothetical protein [Dyella acidiphila]
MLAVVLALHALFALMIWNTMRPPLEVREQSLSVRLIDVATPAKQLPPPATPVMVSLASAPSVKPKPTEKPHKASIDASAAKPAPTQTPPDDNPDASQIFSADGSIRLPPEHIQYSANTPSEVKASKPKDDRQIMEHTDFTHYKPTRFNKYFPPPNETLGGAVGRHIDDVIKEIAKDMCDPEKASTASNLLCGAPPIPPDPKNTDERLNLPPSALAGGGTPAKPVPLSTCIDEYGQGKGLSQGCPVNTAEIIFQAQVRECIDLYRDGKRLKTWCPIDTPKRAAAEASAGSH